MIRINNIVAIKGLIGSFKDKTIFMMLVTKLSFDNMHLCQSVNIRKWRKQYEKEKDEALQEHNLEARKKGKVFDLEKS